MRHTLLLAILIGPTLNLPSTGLAADRRIEGTVKAVDADAGTITLTTGADVKAKDETLDVVKKAKITVNGQAATLKDVRRGQRAVATFNTELEVVTRLDATGEGVAPLAPEITVLRELPEPDVHHTGPWLTADGLTLYWKTQPGTGGGQAWIWTARRKSKDALFEDAKRLVPGSDMTITADGLEMILLQGDSLWLTRRPSLEAAFVRPQKIAEFQNQGFISVPCLSGDDLVLYADRFFPKQPVAPVKSTRAGRQAKWSKPEAVKVDLPAGKRLRFFHVTPDGSRAFGSLFEPTPDQPGNSLNQSELVTMRAEGDGFGRPEVIRVGGETLRGIFPRYVAATNELFYVSREEGKAAEIVLVRNFDPDAIETAPVAPAAASKPARADRELLQGNWASVSEINGGTALTAEQLRGMNKRMEVREERMVISRTGLAGKFAVFEGTFRLDPKAEPKTFDWIGKGPDGRFELHGIYELVGDTFRLCHGPGPRPTELRSTAGSGRQLIVYKRERK